MGFIKLRADYLLFLFRSGTYNYADAKHHGNWLVCGLHLLLPLIYIFIFCLASWPDGALVLGVILGKILPWTLFRVFGNKMKLDNYRMHARLLYLWLYCILIKSLSVLETSRTCKGLHIYVFLNLYNNININPFGKNVISVVISAVLPLMAGCFDVLIV